VPRTPPIIALVAAVAENGIIGRGNALPWHLPADLAHFKRLTLDKPILMGRRTWESLPGLLPRRRHLVLSRDPNYQAPGAIVVTTLDQAIAAAAGESELMVVGGAELYAQTLARADRLYLTLVHASVEGDARFPEWDPADWVEVQRVRHPVDPRNPIPVTFLRLRRLRTP
jgi:dihydrofolate reductase